MNGEILSTIIMLPIALTVTVLFIVGGVKEKGIREKYWGVFGRPKSFFFMYGCIYGVFGLLAGIALMIFPQEEVLGVLIGLPLIFIGIIGAVIAFFIGRSAKKACPEDMKKGLYGSMFLAGWGVFAKLTLSVGLFFLPFILAGLRIGIWGQYGDD